MNQRILSIFMTISWTVTDDFFRVSLLHHVYWVQITTLEIRLGLDFTPAYINSFLS